MAKDAKVKHFKRGEMIYREGDIPDIFFILIDGILKIEKDIQVKHTNFWPSGAREWEVS